MPGFMPGIHVFTRCNSKDVDGRDKRYAKHAVLRTAMPGHDVAVPLILPNDDEADCLSTVMPGLVPGIHVLNQRFK
jgi:hypothetical protein